MKTLIIIPAHNEEANIDRVVSDIKNHLAGYEYLIVNDASTDKTAEILDEHNYSHVDLPINLGLSGAVQTGYQYAYEHGYDCAVQFDGDGQHQAKYIAEMTQEIQNGYGIVIGSRFLEHKKDFSLRMLGSRILSFLIRCRTGKKITDPTSGMRMLNRDMIYDYAFSMNHQPEPDTLTLQLRKGVSIKEIQVSMNERDGGTSMYTSVWNSFKYMVSMIISIIFLS